MSQLLGFVLRTALKDLRLKLRDPFALLIWLGIPLGIGTLISLTFGGDDARPQAHVLVVDEDDNFLSQLLLGALGRQQGEGLFLVEQVSEEEGRARIDAGEASALLVIPAGFAHALLAEEPCTLRLFTNPSQSILPRMVEETLQVLVDGSFYLHRVFGGPLEQLTLEPPEGRNTLPDATVAELSTTINGIVERLGTTLFPPVLDVEFEAQADESDGADLGELFFPSILFMMLFFLAGGLAEDLWVEKERGTLRRVLSLPIPPSACLAGKGLAAMILVAAIVGIGFLLGRHAFGLPLRNLALGVAWAGLSGGFLYLLMVLIHVFATSQRAGSMLANVVTMPLLMLGGSFFPFEVMPDWMAALGKRTPNGWALEQLKAILADDIDAAGLGYAALGITVVSLFLFWVAARRIAGPFARS